MSKQNKHIILRIVLGVLPLIIVGAAGFSIWVAQHYKAVLMERLPGWVAKTTDSAYNISVEDISINIITRRVTAYNVKIWPDTNQIKRLKERGKTITTTFNVTIPEVQVSGILWENVVSDQELDCKRLAIIQPVINISATPKIIDSLKKDLADTSKKTPFIQRIYASYIEVEHPKITYRFTGDSDSFYYKIQDGNILLNDWEIIHGGHKDTNRFFHAKSAMITLDSFTYVKPGGLYIIKSSSLKFITDENNLWLENLNVRLSVTKDEFYKRAGQQKEIYDLDFPSIHFANIDWKRLIKQKELVSSSVNIDTPSLDIFFSRLFPPNKKSKVGKYPHQLLQRLKLKVDIDTVKITAGHFKYTEVNEKTRKEGVLLFDDIHGTINNVTNMPALIAQNKNCIIKLNGEFMGRSDMGATFNLLLSDTTGGFSIDAYLKNLSADQITNQAKALALAEVTSFNLKRMDMHIEGNQTYAKGHFTLLYDNLKIQLQKLDSDRNLSRRPFLSFLANKVLLYPSNPMPNQDVRSVDTYVPRDKLKSFFNQIWKNMYQAAQKTALRNEKIVDMLKKNGGKKKKHGGLKALIDNMKKKNKQK